MNENCPSSRFIDFARTAEAIGATTKRLEKAALLQKCFEALGDDDLVLAARYFGGMLFPDGEGCAFNL